MEMSGCVAPNKFVVGPKEELIYKISLLDVLFLKLLKGSNFPILPYPLPLAAID